MKFPEELKYSKEHEWVRMDGNVATAGISDHAQDALGEIVFLEFQLNEGDKIVLGDVLGSVESVKAVSDIYSPVSGTITELNQKLADAPETVNQDPYGKGWMVRIEMSDPGELDGLMDAAGYQKYVAEESG